MNKELPPIAFKGSTVAVILINLQTLCPRTLAEAARILFGENDFFEGDAGVLNLAQMTLLSPDAPQPEPDWQGIRALFARHGLHVVGVCGAEAEIVASARKAGLAVFPNAPVGGVRHAVDVGGGAAGGRAPPPPHPPPMCPRGPGDGGT
ncbi:MAG: hypothetical protein LBJ59_11485, partial [Zoogloeaceae bacterium]|nr:hypothetical protein [Zoogloeaceae bacterium]